MARAADDARLGPVYVLNITAPDEAALHALVEAGYDVASVHGLTATIYATPAERQTLLATGWPVTEVDQTADIEKTLGVYHTYDSLTTELVETYASLHPDICRMQSLGKSYQNRELWALLITDYPDADEDEPECKFVATMHGDEPIGMELCLYLIDLLLNQYGTDERITSLVDNTALWIVPLMNPDGLENEDRRNAQGYDLNRRFPNYPNEFTGTIFNTPLDVSGRPPEVACIMNWTAQESFTLAANFHTGALVVNYPYDHEEGIPSGQPAPSPDEVLFQDISRRYSINNSPMWNNPAFEDGITNGSDWYAITGGMQDWDYRFAACNHVTVELFNTIKKPDKSTLAQLWEDNRESMLAYLESAHIGVRGIVTDAGTGEPVYAQVRVVGNSQPVFTDPDAGDYHRMLLPGTYTLVVSAPGYITQRIEGVAVGEGVAVIADAELEESSIPATRSPLARLLLMLLLAIFGLRLLFGKSSDEAHLAGALLLMPALFLSAW
ncbi:MAG TPA: M14 family zinc carboxypeptidase [Candidatus Bathyarchaeia archaeon]|nr:M14 family zinc carboxypeptidase [Candidatus Bathyarchaeia archaeon]